MEARSSKKKGGGCFQVLVLLTGRLQVPYLLYYARLWVAQYNGYRNFHILQVLTGEPSFFTVCARTASHVACLSRQVVFDLMSVQPDVTLHLAGSVIDHMSGFVRSIGRGKDL